MTLYSENTLAHDTLGNGTQLRLSERVERHWQATRPGFFTAAIMPVLVGTAWGASVHGALDVVSALMFLIGFVLGQAAGNVINDVCDDLSGNDALNEDRISPFTGGSRTIQDNRLSRRAMARFACVLLCGCAATGLYLVPVHGLEVLVYGFALAIILLAYHLPPLRLNHRGMAEVVVGLMFGVFPVGMAAWLQSGTVDLPVLLLSLPVTLWIANVLLINEVPDLKADRAVNKVTLAVLVGARGALRVHMVVTSMALAILAGLSLVAGLLPWWSLIVPGLLSVPAVVLVAVADPDDRAAMTRAIKTTIGLHAVASLWLAIAAGVS